MFDAIVAGTDGSPTAETALRAAVDLARQGRSRLYIVSAYEPVSGQRVRSEQLEVPQDMQWAVGPRSDVLELPEGARRSAGIDQAVAVVDVRDRAAEGLGRLLEAGEHLSRSGVGAEDAAGDDEGGGRRYVGRGHRSPVPTSGKAEVVRSRGVGERHL